MANLLKFNELAVFFDQNFGQKNTKPPLARNLKLFKQSNLL
jgi:hypothetical protein